jgi:rare lipoprotein A
MLAFISILGFNIKISENNNDKTELIIEENKASETLRAMEADLSLVEFEDLGLMKASWYGPRFHGRKTANGERFDQMAFTVAHKSMKFGTLLRLTNPKNGRSIVVRVNDRGPYIEGRELDLSKAAAHELGLIRRGVARLKVEKINIVGLETNTSN